MLVHTVATGLQHVRVGKAEEFRALLQRDRYKHNNNSLDDVNHATPQAYAITDIATYSPRVVQCVLSNSMLSAGQ